LARTDDKLTLEVWTDVVEPADAVPTSQIIKEQLRLH
jgi:hypothetical protein